MVVIPLHGQEALKFIAYGALIALAVLVVVFVTLGLLCSAIVLVCSTKKRRLLWIPPLVNVIVWICGLHPLIADLWKLELSQLLVIDAIAIPIVAACGLVSSAMLAPLQLMFRNLFRRSSVDDGAAENLLGIQPEQVAADIKKSQSHVVADLLKRIPSQNKWGAFCDGLRTPWDGFVYLCHYPSLWRYGLIPVVLNLLITAGVLLIFMALSSEIVVLIHQRFPEGWGWLILEVTCVAALLLLIIGGALVTWMLLQGILCGHFYGKMAKQIELQLGTAPKSCTISHFFFKSLIRFAICPHSWRSTADCCC